MATIPQRVLAEALVSSSRNYPAKTALIIKDREYTYSSFFENALRFANHLVNNGLKKGDRVAIYMNNSWYSIIAIYGISMAGGVFLVINPQTKSDKLQYILNDSESIFLVTETILENELIPALEGIKTAKKIIYSGSFISKQPFENFVLFDIEKDILNLDVQAILPRVIPNDLAALIYTSGSTGFPKGVMMTHQSMVFTAWSLIEYLRLNEDDRIILLLPLAFDYGLYQLLMSVTIGGSLLVEQSFTFQKSIYKQIEKYKPTVFPGVPTIYAMMIATNKKNGLRLDGIKKITNTAAALPAEFIPDLKNIFPNALIFKMYGLTECKRVCYLEPEMIDIKPGSVGKAIPGTEVFLMSPDGKKLPNGSQGILHIRGPHVMLGYWHKEELSKEMLKNGDLPGERILSSNDWFRSDEEGYLYFLGRTDDIIKTRGEKVSPVEIENIIYKINGVREVAVIGIPDVILGESIIAFVTMHDTDKMNENEVQKICAARLEVFMIPQKVVFLEEMPKNTNGKIDKKVLKENYNMYITK